MKGKITIHASATQSAPIMTKLWIEKKKVLEIHVIKLANLWRVVSDSNRLLVCLVILIGKFFYTCLSTLRTNK